ncbi:MAG: hypothetical protein Q9174_000584, partial [Haloplaca sp. 1 TL-2023]
FTPTSLLDLAEATIATFTPASSQRLPSSSSNASSSIGSSSDSARSQPTWSETSTPSPRLSESPTPPSPRPSSMELPSFSRRSRRRQSSPPSPPYPELPSLSRQSRRQQLVRSLNTPTFADTSAISSRRQVLSSQISALSPRLSRSQLMSKLREQLLVLAREPLASRLPFRRVPNDPLQRGPELTLINPLVNPVPLPVPPFVPDYYEWHPTTILLEYYRQRGFHPPKHLHERFHSLCKVFNDETYTDSHQILNEAHYNRVDWLDRYSESWAQRRFEKAQIRHVAMRREMPTRGRSVLKDDNGFGARNRALNESLGILNTPVKENLRPSVGANNQSQDQVGCKTLEDQLWDDLEEREEMAEDSEMTKEMKEGMMITEADVRRRVSKISPMLRMRQARQKRMKQELKYAAGKERSMAIFGRVMDQETRYARQPTGGPATGSFKALRENRGSRSSE